MKIISISQINFYVTDSVWKASDHHCVPATDINCVGKMRDRWSTTTRDPRCGGRLSLSLSLSLSQGPEVSHRFGELSSEKQQTSFVPQPARTNDRNLKPKMLLELGPWSFRADGSSGVLDEKMIDDDRECCHFKLSNCSPKPNAVILNGSLPTSPKPNAVSTPLPTRGQCQWPNRRAALELQRSNCRPVDADVWTRNT